MSLLSFLVPNLDWSAVIGIGVAVFGALLMFFGWNVYGFRAVPFRARTRISTFLRGVGTFMIIGGLLYWFGASLFTDLWANTRTRAVMIAGVFVTALAALLFWPRNDPYAKRRAKPKKKRK